MMYLCVLVCPNKMSRKILFLSCFFFWPRPTACGILVSQPGMEPKPPALEARSLNHWTVREVPKRYFFLNED